MSHLQPEQIVDVNGHLTTRHKKVQTDSGKPSRATTAPSLGTSVSIPRVDVHELTDALHEVAEAMLDYPGDAQQAWETALRENAQSNGEYALLLVLVEDKGLAEPYRVTGNTSAEDFSKKLASASITEEDMRDIFGSQWAEVSDVVAKVGMLNNDQKDAILRGNGGIRAGGEFAVETRDMWEQVRTHTSVGRISDNAAAAVRMAAPFDSAGGNMERSTHHLIERGIRALSLRPLIGSNRVTQEYYDRDTAHLVRGIGKLHPSD